MSGGIYVASKTRHAALWRELRAGGLPIVSTWIDEAGPGESVSSADLWRRCVNEASGADALIAYALPSETAKGSLVEIGAALGASVPVLAFGFDAEQTFQNHPLVWVCQSLDAAIDRARLRVAERAGRRRCETCRGSGFDPSRFRTSEPAKPCPTCGEKVGAA